MGIEIIDKDLGWDRITKEIKNLGKLESGVGLYGDGGDPSTNIAARGAVHEFGVEIKVTPKMRGFLNYIGIHLNPGTTYITIPKRSFMASTFDERNKVWYNFSVIAIDKLLSGSWDAKKLLSAISQRVQDDIMTKMESNIRPVLHPVTISRKGSSRSLIDTGDMKNRITFKIKRRK